MQKRIAATMGMTVAAMAALAGSATEPPKQAPSAQMIASCAVCHGERGQGLEARSAPQLAGLDADFLRRQLDAFATGKRGKQPGDAFGSQMFVIAQSLKPEDRAAAAAHYAGMKESGVHSTLKADSAAGKAGYESCASCHGENGKGNAELGAPRISGQADWYILHSLNLYRSGARGHAGDDAQAQQMAAAVKTVDDKQLAAISAYAASLSSR